MEGQPIVIHEVNGKELPAGDERSLRVSSHEIFGSRVVLAFEGKQISVIGSDLIWAIHNAVRKET